ncbi:ribonuclease P protein component [Texcoconibacillus texcoconensis]|uniref:Ribonuclease P protein component n=1 Tax=Texcoconibacillus texcoconensis TaxID=1095777 RepID=A0A840QTD2_9BACI|nr:ribonuclease P protein component [Texcoconibacillus texcoconensis]MBB5174782.1 ribonuclease P protein component [Texcoconibacillus texcoconensis]
MKKEYRLKKNEEFQEVFKKGKSFANRQLVLYKCENQNQEHFRVGLSVSKKIGNAVVRNQIKRYLREAIRHMDPPLKGGYDYIVIARKPIRNMSSNDIQKSLHHVSKKAGALDRRK